MAQESASSVIARVRSETFVRHVEWHEEIGSTNDRAIELATDVDLPRPALVLAERQSSGRGRGANVWRSGLGALTFSLVIDRPSALPRERMPVVSLIAGLATRDAIAAVAPGQIVKVKWPNDVYLAGRKLCGILTEVPSAAPDRVVIGIGVSVNNSLAAAPEEIRSRAVSLIEAIGHTVDAGELLVALLVRLEAALAALEATGGLPVAQWAAHCLLTGRDVRLRTPAEEITGRCIGVTDSGALLVDGLQGVRTCHGGEVILF